MTFPLDFSLFSKAATIQILLLGSPVKTTAFHVEFPSVEISGAHRGETEVLPRTLRRPRKKGRGRNRVVQTVTDCRTARISVLKGARYITLESFSLAELPESEVVFDLN